MYEAPEYTTRCGDDDPIHEALRAASSETHPNDDPRKFTWAMVDARRTEADQILDNMPDEFWNREAAQNARALEEGIRATATAQAVR